MATLNDFNPKWFGMTGKPLSYLKYINLLNSGAKQEKTGYLLYLIEYVQNSGRMSPAKKKIMLETFKKLDRGTKNNIEKNFGETIGPLGILKLNLFGTISDTSKFVIEYPTAENLGLYDYLISKDGGKKSKRISAKKLSGKTNTVKPRDIIEAFRDSKSIPQNAKFAYSFVSLIANESTNEGSQKALELLKRKYSEVRELLPNEFANKPVTSKVLAETVFEKLSRDSTSAFSKEMNKLFWSALEQLDVYYIKFGLSNGIPIFDLVGDQLITQFEDGKIRQIKNPEDNQPFVYFRGKGREAGVKRAEKPGFQL